MGKESVESREERARDSNTSPGALEKLAADENEDVRFQVAENPNTPASALEKLAADENEDVRDGAFENPNTPASLLEKLAADEDENVRFGAAGNPNIPASLLEKLAADENEIVRCRVAVHQNTPASALEKLAADENEDVRNRAAGNPNTPASALEKLAADEVSRKINSDSKADTELDNDSPESTVEIHGVGCEVVIRNITESQTKQFRHKNQIDTEITLDAIQEIMGDEWYENGIFHTYCPIADGLSITFSNEKSEVDIDKTVIAYDAEQHWCFPKPFDMANQELFENESLDDNYLIVVSMEKGHWSDVSIPTKDFDIDKFKLVTHPLKCQIENFNLVYGYSYNNETLDPYWETGIHTEGMGHIIFVMQGDQVIEHYKSY